MNTPLSKKFIETVTTTEPSYVYCDKQIQKLMSVKVQPDIQKEIGGHTLKPIYKTHELYTQTLKTYQHPSQVEKLQQSVICEGNIHCASIPFTINLNKNTMVWVELIVIEEAGTYAVVLKAKGQPLEKIHIIMYQLLQKQDPDGVCASVGLCEKLGLHRNTSKKVLSNQMMRVDQLSSKFVNLLVTENLRKVHLNTSSIKKVLDPPQLVYSLQINKINILCHVRNGGLTLQKKNKQNKLDYHLFLNEDQEK